MIEEQWLKFLREKQRVAVLPVTAGFVNLKIVLTLDIAPEATEWQDNKIKNGYSNKINK